MTDGGSEFIKMIQKNNKITCICFYLCWAGGKINRPGQLAPRGEDNQGGGQDIAGQLAPQGASQLRLACPRGVSCPGGKINWDTCPWISWNLVYIFLTYMDSLYVEMVSWQRPQPVKILIPTLTEYKIYSLKLGYHAIKMNAHPIS